MIIVRDCLVCGTTFRTRAATHKVCSQACRKLIYRHRAFDVPLLTPELEDASLQSDVRPITVRVRSTDRCRSAEEGSEDTWGAPVVQVGDTGVSSGPATETAARDHASASDAIGAA